MFRAETDVNRPLPSMGHASVALAAASWGTWCVFLRLAGSGAPVLPQLSTFVVMATQMLVLCPFALGGLRRRLRAPSAAECALLVGFGVADALNCLLYFAALDTTSVSVAVLTHYAAPLLVALGAPLLLREPGRAGTLGAVFLGLFGLTLLLAPWHGAGSDPGLVRGAFAGLGSAVFYAAGVLFNKRLSRSFEPAELIVYHLPPALLSLSFLIPHGGWALSGSALTWLMLGALGPGALAGIVFIRGLRQIPAAQASILTFIEPLTALCIAALAWHEPLDPSALVGGAAILFAGYLVVRQREATPLRASAGMD